MPVSTILWDQKKEQMMFVRAAIRACCVEKEHVFALSEVIHFATQHQLSDVLPSLLDDFFRILDTYHRTTNQNELLKQLYRYPIYQDAYLSQLIAINSFRDALVDFFIRNEEWNMLLHLMETHGIRLNEQQQSSLLAMHEAPQLIEQPDAGKVMQAPYRSAVLLIHNQITIDPWLLRKYLFNDRLACSSLLYRKLLNESSICVADNSIYDELSALYLPLIKVSSQYWELLFRRMEVFYRTCSASPSIDDRIKNLFLESFSVSEHASIALGREQLLKLRKAMILTTIMLNHLNGSSFIEPLKFCSSHEIPIKNFLYYLECLKAYYNGQVDEGVSPKLLAALLKFPSEIVSLQSIDVIERAPERWFHEALSNITSVDEVGSINF